MKKFYFLALAALVLSLAACGPKVIEKKFEKTNFATVTVEGSTANLYSDKSVYLPTKTQKKSAQTAQDLIQRMAIPQLAVDEDIKTNTGQQVDIYI